ncbi:Glycosyltransferase KanE (plasmid) [Paracoccaceae bacterium]|nr:Glycosyltransferase KanE [Paracoccaceae bacterium]
MKVLLLNSQPVDYTIAFANGLAPHAETVAVLPRDLYAPLRKWIDPRVRLELVDWPRTRSLRNPAFLRRLVQIVRDEQPDVLHLLSNTTLWLNAAAPFWRAPVLVTTVHDVGLHPGDRDTARLPGWGARLMARQSDHVIVHGDRLRHTAARALAMPRDRIHVLPHPAIRRYADLARAEGMRRSRPPEEFVVLLFGRIFAYKGLTTLIRAEAALDRSLPGLRLVIAGRGDDPRALMDQMGDPDRYQIHTGHIPDALVAELFTEADVVVLPYDEASQSGVLHVAATFGKPVVVTDVGELRATVEPNDTGLVIPPRSPQALARALRHLAADPEDRARLGRNALRWSQGPNAPCTIGASALALYRELVESRPPLSTERIAGQAEGPNCPARRPGS